MKQTRRAFFSAVAAIPAAAAIPIDELFEACHVVAVRPASDDVIAGVVDVPMGVTVTGKPIAMSPGEILMVEVQADAPSASGLILDVYSSLDGTTFTTRADIMFGLENDDRIAFDLAAKPAYQFALRSHGPGVRAGIRVRRQVLTWDGRSWGPVRQIIGPRE